jgi:hypothetical protein
MQHMMRWFSVGLFVLLVWVATAGAQGLGENCRHGTPNRNGTAGANITVGVAAVTVVTPNTNLCKAFVTNISSSQSIRCRQVDGTEVTATNGFQLLPQQVMAMDKDAQLGFRCIRDTTATGDSAVSVYEIEP